MPRSSSVRTTPGDEVERAEAVLPAEPRADAPVSRSRAGLLAQYAVRSPRSRCRRRWPRLDARGRRRGDHVRDDGAAQRNWPAHVDLDVRHHCSASASHSGSSARSPGAVDQEVDAAEVVGRRRHAVVDVGRVGDLGARPRTCRRPTATSRSRVARRRGPRPRRPPRDLRRARRRAPMPRPIPGSAPVTTATPLGPQAAALDGAGRRPRRSATAASRSALTSSRSACGPGRGSAARRPGTACPRPTCVAACRRRRAAATPAARRARRAAPPRRPRPGRPPSTTSATSCLATGKVENGVRRHGALAGRAEHVEVELDGAGARRQAERREDLRVQLAGVPDERAVGERERGAAAGVPGRVLVGADDASVDGQRRRRPRAPPRRRRPSRPVGPGPTSRPARRRRPAATRDPARLVRHARRPARRAPRRRAAVRPRGPGPRRSGPPGRKTRPDLEERRRRVQPAADVAPQRLEQARAAAWCAAAAPRRTAGWPAAARGAARRRPAARVRRARSVPTNG